MLQGKKRLSAKMLRAINPRGRTYRHLEHACVKSRHGCVRQSRAFPSFIMIQEQHSLTSVVRRGRSNVASAPRIMTGEGVEGRQGAVGSSPVVLSSITTSRWPAQSRPLAVFMRVKWRQKQRKVADAWLSWEVIESVACETWYVRVDEPWVWEEWKRGGTTKLARSTNERRSSGALRMFPATRLSDLLWWCQCISDQVRSVALCQTPSKSLEIPSRPFRAREPVSRRDRSSYE